MGRNFETTPDAAAACWLWVAKLEPTTLNVELDSIWQNRRPFGPTLSLQKG